MALHGPPEGVGLDARNPREDKEAAKKKAEAKTKKSDNKDWRYAADPGRRDRVCQRLRARLGAGPTS